MSHISRASSDMKILVGKFEEPRSGRQTERAFTFNRSLFLIKNPNPPPPRPSIHDAVLTPEVTSGFFNRLWFVWLTPVLSLGHVRPLEASDLYKLPDERSSTRIAEAIFTSCERRHKWAMIYNERLASGQAGPGIKGLWWSVRGVRAEKEKAWRERHGKRKAITTA